MRLYLVQHGEATSREENPERPLTEKGRADVERVAEFAARAGAKPVVIRHSGKKRAEETAEIMASRLEPAGGVEAAEGLSPLDDVAPVAEKLSGEAGDMMLVGHLPFMDRLASLLAAGDAARSVARFQPGGIVCLEREEGKWRVVWMVTGEVV